MPIQSILSTLRRRKSKTFNRHKAVIRLAKVIENIDSISISDFKEVLGHIATESDLRAKNDITDFSWMRRRKTD